MKKMCSPLLTLCIKKENSLKALINLTTDVSKTFIFWYSMSYQVNLTIQLYLKNFDHLSCSSISFRYRGKALVVWWKITKLQTINKFFSQIPYVVNSAVSSVVTVAILFWHRMSISFLSSNHFVYHPCRSFY